jgi:transcriptional regulator
MKKIWTKDKIKLLCNFKKGYSNIEIAKLFNTTIHAIEAAIKRHCKRTKKELFNRRSIDLTQRLKNRLGKCNPNWKGGISSNNYHYKKLQIERYPDRTISR